MPAFLLLPASGRQCSFNHCHAFPVSSIGCTFLLFSPHLMQMLPHTDWSPFDRCTHTHSHTHMSVSRLFPRCHSCIRAPSALHELKERRIKSLSYPCTTIAVTAAVGAGAGAGVRGRRNGTREGMSVVTRTRTRKWQERSGRKRESKRSTIDSLLTEPLHASGALHAQEAICLTVDEDGAFGLMLTRIE